MNIMTTVMLVFSLLGAFDRIIGNRFGIGKEFEKGFMMFGANALSMIGMIVISPWIADTLSPVFTVVREALHLDPSLIPAMLFANDMGGASLSAAIAADEQLGLFNGLVISSMMGATISFTIPYSLEVVSSKQHRWLLLGLLCGIVTIPFGCFGAGLMSGIPLGPLLYNLLLLQIFSVIIAVGLLKFPGTCIKIFGAFAFVIKMIITIGLAIGIVQFLTGIQLIKNMSTLEEGAAICLNSSVVMSGAFPLIYILSKVLVRPLGIVSKRLGINETSALGFLSSLATNITTFGMMEKMDDKGARLNSAFAVSAAFVFAGHMAFTMAFDASYVGPVIVGKLIAGVLALFFANFIYQYKSDPMER